MTVALNAQARTLIATMESSGLPKLYELSPEEARAQAAELNALIGPGPDVDRVSEITIPTPTGGVGGRMYEPAEAPGTVVWFHSGGWVIGDLESHDSMCRLMAVSSGCRVLAVDYRRAPEHRFPAALEDCWDALRYAAAEHGARPLVVGGDSAGGNMAAVCALRSRDRGGPELVLQVLVYPVTDFEMTTPSYLERGSGPEAFLTADDMRWFADQYLPDGAARRQPEAAPLRAKDLLGLPAALVLTAEYDPLRDEGLAYAERLREAGVPVTHFHYEDMIHSFFAFVNLLERGSEAVEAVSAEIRAAVSS